MIEKLILLAIFLVFSAFFSSIETAFFSLPNLRIIHLVKSKVPNARLVQKMKNNSHRLLITILIGNNLVNVAASVLAAAIADEVFGSSMIAAVTGVMTLMLLIFGEITPKALATVYNEKMALTFARPVRMLSIILHPIVVVLDTLTVWITKSLSRGKTKPVVTETEIKHIVEEGVRIGEIKESEEDMIRRVFRFDEIEVGEIMTPRPDVKAIPAKTKLKDAVKTFLKHNHTRIPVFEKTKDQIIGIAHLQDVFSAIYAKKGMKTIREVMDPVFFFPETLTCDKALKQFQNKQQHLAIVVNEYGTVVGLVTLEDVLEEIVGEIVDETDKFEKDIERLNKTTWQVQGSTDVEDFSDYFNLNLRTHHIDTVSGYVMLKLNRIPNVGDNFKIKRFKCVVDDMQRHRVISVKMVK